MGPKKLFFFKLITRRLVKNVMGSGSGPRRLRFSRTRRDTRLCRQETPNQAELQGSEVAFQVVRTVLEGSTVDLKRRRGSTSGFVAADKKVQWRRKRIRRGIDSTGFNFAAIGGILW